MRTLGAVSLLLFLVLLALLPVVFGQLFASALLKLRLEPTTALVVVIGIFMGSVINIPVKRMLRTEPMTSDSLALFGLPVQWPSTRRVQRDTVIAINVGGCIVPVALAIYETVQLMTASWQFIPGLLGAVVINTVVCFRMARPIEGIGIAIPGLLPPLVAATSAVLLMPDQAPAVAFVAGVFGPLIGADLLHLRDISKIATGIASIGGAGTFDGIVLSGIVAAYLA